MDCAARVRWTISLRSIAHFSRLRNDSCPLCSQASFNRAIIIMALFSFLFVSAALRLKRSKIRIILGDHDQTTTTDAEAKMRAVSAIIRHRNFDANTYNHDIALLRLRKPVTFTKNIKPVCLPKEDNDPAGKTGVAVGWGRTSEGGSLPGKRKSSTTSDREL